MDNTIQMNLFEYFLDEEKFSIQEATNLVKNVKNMNVNNESIRARIYEGVEKGIFTKISRGVYKVTSQIEGTENCTFKVKKYFTKSIFFLSILNLYLIFFCFDVYYTLCKIY